MRKSKINRRGITLVSLVITMVIIIILAGITINSIVGKNGILYKAKVAKEEHEKARELEQKLLESGFIIGNREDYESQEIESFLIEITETKGTSLVANIKEIQHKDNTRIAGYAWVLNGEVIVCTQEKEFVFSGIEMYKDYKVQAIAIDKNFKFKWSNEECIKTSNKEEFEYTGKEQLITLGAGKYKIECWGAQGNYTTGMTVEGGKGAYVSGELEVKEKTNLYVYVGEHRNDKKESFNVGTIGGASAGYGGGGATDIRLENGNWNEIQSLRSRIMVAAGGGRSFKLSVFGSRWCWW